MPKTITPKSALNIAKIRSDFPILSKIHNGKPLVYLDNAATSQKPRAVIEAIKNYYENSNANIKRTVHFLGEEATLLYEHARQSLAAFLKTNKPHEIIFTKNVTEAINLVAHSYAKTHLKKGAEIVLTKMEHHSNLVPWLMLAAENELVIKYIDVDQNGRLILGNLDQILSKKTGLVAVGYVSNALGTINPVKEIIQKAHTYGAKVLIDAAQAAPHLPINVKELDCDFLGITAHKMFGPTGIGALYLKEEIADLMPPFLGGGEMIKEVFKDSFVPAELPEKFEAGTPHIAGAIGFKAAIDYLNTLGFEAIIEYEQELAEYALEKLKTLPYLKIIGPLSAEKRVPTFSFVIDGIHPHDISEILSREGICTRAGFHCAQPLMDELNLPGTTRASLSFYNTTAEIDALIAGLATAYKIFI